MVYYGFCTPSHLKLFNENLSKSSGDMEAHERVTDGQTKGIPIIILPLCCGGLNRECFLTIFFDIRGTLRYQCSRYQRLTIFQLNMTTYNTVSQLVTDTERKKQSYIPNPS